MPFTRWAVTVISVWAGEYRAELPTIFVKTWPIRSSSPWIIGSGAWRSTWRVTPWRSANNVNQTGFPEPPPYAGDKRIFQAELFYDVTHPVRRKLHEAYIRQCLDNFTNNANVIQFTSAEFTGPLHFMEFWLDTVAAWERGAAAPSLSLRCTLASTSSYPLVSDNLERKIIGHR